MTLSQAALCRTQRGAGRRGWCRGPLRSVGAWSDEAVSSVRASQGFLPSPADRPREEKGAEDITRAVTDRSAAVWKTARMLESVKLSAQQTHFLRHLAEMDSRNISLCQIRTKKSRLLFFSVPKYTLYDIYHFNHCVRFIAMESIHLVKPSPPSSISTTFPFHLPQLKLCPQNTNPIPNHGNHHSTFCL